MILARSLLSLARLARAEENQAQPAPEPSDGERQMQEFDNSVSVHRGPSERVKELL
jgi:hypothetical protein